MKSNQEIKSKTSANLKLKIFKQTNLCFIFQPQKPKVQSSFWNHRKLKTMKLQHPMEHCRNPTLAKCGGEAQHSQSWGLGVLRDSRMFRVQQQGPKHLTLTCSWCDWKGLEA
jgi:hypothetical protein